MAVNYAIMRSEKYHGNLHALEAECQRSESEPKTFLNSDIDWSKTHDNVTLVSTTNWNKAFRDAVAETGCRTRKDSVKIVQTLYTATPEFLDGLSRAEQEEFFRACLEYHKQEFGSAHILSAVVHYDESSPHLHVTQIPIIKRADGTHALSAKEMMGNRTEYHERQNRFYAAVGVPWGLERGVPASDTRRAHKTKRDLERDCAALTRELHNLQEQRTNAEQFVLSGTEIHAEYKTAGVIDRRDVVQVSAADYEQLKHASYIAQQTAEQNEELRANNAHNLQTINELQQQNELLQRHNRDLKQNLSAIRDKFNWFLHAIEYLMPGTVKTLLSRYEAGEKPDEAQGIGIMISL